MQNLCRDSLMFVEAQRSAPEVRHSLKLTHHRCFCSYLVAAALRWLRLAEADRGVDVW